MIPGAHIPVELCGAKMTRPPTSQEILKEFRTFMSGVSCGSKFSRVELARSAIFLLKTLPAAREAILDYMCVVFDDAVAAHSIKLELEMGTSVNSSNTSSVPSVGSDNDDDIIRDVQDVLTEFINLNPECWAPIVSSWSLDLLGQISSKYADRRGILHASNLNEILQLWMSCPPTHILVDLSTLCISTLINSNPDQCIDALLDTSVQHSPHFDWVVAHIGSCFPTTIITRVLACGLKDFCSHGSESHASSGSSVLPMADKKVPKLASVVGILGHLAGQHNEDIRKALLALFTESFVDLPNIQHMATVPFLLQLSSMSAMLRRVVTLDLIKTLSPEVLSKLCIQIPLWCKQTGQSPDELMSLAVHLVLKSENGGEQITKFLLNAATPSNEDGVCNLPEVQTVCGRILDFLLFEIHCLVNSKTNNFQGDIPILEALHESVPMLCERLLKGTPKEAHWVTRLLTCLATNSRDSKASDIVAYILLQANDPKQLGLLENLISLIEPSLHDDHLVAAISKIFIERVAESRHCELQFFRNLLYLVQREAHGYKCHSNFTDCLHKFLLPLANEISDADLDTANCVMEILGHIPLSEALPISVLMSLGTAAVSHFFLVLRRVETPDMITHLANHRKFITKLCEHYSIQQLVLRSLLEGALDASNTWCFGSRQHAALPAVDDVNIEMEHLPLLRENQKHGLSIAIPQIHSMNFHGGVIGHGLLASGRSTSRSCKDKLISMQLFVEAIKAACVPCRCTPEKFIPGPVPTTEGMTTVALLLVELVSSDIMFNGFPWPEEDFVKVTIERDLHIYRMFEDNPILWELVHLVAFFRPALCYCSVLLRALAATTMSFWAGCQQMNSRDYPTHLEMTQNLIDVMAVGQILPPPLCYAGEILCHISPFEMYILLSDIWKYMKDNVPSPAAFTAVDSNGYRYREFETLDSKYVEKLHCILQNNIVQLGPVFAHFFTSETNTNNQSIDHRLSE